MKRTNTNQTVSACALNTLSAVALGLMLTVGLLGSSRNAQAGIVPADEKFRGLSYGEWGARYWINLFAIPVVADQHPYLQGGAYDGDKGMLYLAALPGGVTIPITVPAGTAIFCPVMNAECSVLEPDPFHGDNEAELRECANGHIDNTSGLFFEIDGVPVTNLDDYRVESPLFQFTLPANNLFAYFGLDAPAGTTSLAVDAGVYVLLEPLSVGKHTIHVGGTFDLLGYSIDTTFDITVTSKKK